MNRWSGPAVIAAFVLVAGVVVTMRYPGATVRDASSLPLGAAQKVPRPEVFTQRIDTSRPIEIGDVEPDPEWRWGRAEIVSTKLSHFPPKGNWNEAPSLWIPRSVADVPGIPTKVRAALNQFDCVLPKFRQFGGEGAMAWGEFERRGQRDLAILCAHADGSSSTYIFWNGDSERREVMPWSGSSINRLARSEVETRADRNLPREADMPATVDHDALEIGCCECCSVIFYRHNGKWFTLPGAD